jgi:hypothetical protein
MPKKIGLIDVDSKWKTHGNLALMKIYAYHKMKGDHVEWAHPLYFKLFDAIYASSLFTTSNKEDIPYFAVKGGPGYLNENIFNITLPPEIESCNPDYHLYPRLDFSYQRYSTGCPNRCPFCVVPTLEGAIAPQKPLALNPRGKYIYILDSNFFANPEWKRAIEHLRQCNQPVHWEGIDIRLLTTEMLLAIFSMPLKGRIHIAWDSANEDIDNRIYNLIPVTLRRYVMCYVLIGFNSKPEEDLYRVETLRSLGVDPFVMPFDRRDEYQRNFARWCNHKPIWKTIPWANYTWKKNNQSVSISVISGQKKRSHQ